MGQYSFLRDEGFHLPATVNAGPAAVRRVTIHADGEADIYGNKDGAGSFALAEDAVVTL